MKFNFNTKDLDCDYMSRIFLFIRRNFKLYLLDITLLIILLIPPYSKKELIWILLILAFLAIRDILVMIKSIYHITEFTLKDEKVKFKIFRYSTYFSTLELNAGNIEMNLNSILGIPYLQIFDGPRKIFTQLPVGSWSGQKLEELFDQFYSGRNNKLLHQIFK